MSGAAYLALAWCSLALLGGLGGLAFVLGLRAAS